MNPVLPEELSALVDGELESKREREVRAALAESPELRAQFESLRRLDASLRSVASAAAFEPRIQIAKAQFPWPSLFALVVLLVSVRLALKWVDTEALVWLANAAVFIAVMTVIVRLARLSGHDRESVRV